MLGRNQDRKYHKVCKDLYTYYHALSIRDVYLYMFVFLYIHLNIKYTYYSVQHLTDKTTNIISFYALHAHLVSPC
jgi:hypothetical protein